MDGTNSFGANLSMTLPENYAAHLQQRQRDHAVEFVEHRVLTLDNLVKQKEMDLSVERQKYKSLKEDFEYNLKLLAGRDEELRRYDATFGQLKRTIQEKDEVISELKSALATQESVAKSEKSRCNEIEVYYQEKMQELREEVEHLRLGAADELKKTTEEYESLLDDYKRKIKEREDELQQAKKQMQFKYQSDMDAQRLESEKQLKQKDEKMRSLKKEMEEGFNQAMAQAMEKINADWEKKLDEQRRSNAELQDELVAQKRRTQDELKNLQWEIEDKLKVKDNEVEMVKSQLQHDLNQKDKEVDQLNQRLWALEQELRTVREKYETQKTDLQDRRNDIADLKQQLNEQLEKERKLTRELLRQQLQEEKDDDDRTRRIAAENEKLIRSLQQEKIEYLATIDDQKIQMDELRAKFASAQRENESLQQRLRSAVSTAPQRAQQLSRSQIERDLDDELGIGSISIPSLNTTLESPVRRYPEPRAVPRQPDYPDVSRLEEALEKADQELREKDQLIRQLQDNRRQSVSRSSIDDSSSAQALRQLTDEIVRLKSELEMRKDVADSANFTKLNTIITDLRIDVEQYKDKFNKAEGKNAQLLEENRALKSKLKDAARDLKRLMKEREKLIDVSNGVKAELDKTKEELQVATSSSKHKGHSEMSDQQILVQSELTKQRTELNQLRTNIRDLEDQNLVLRRELQRWTGQKVYDDIMVNIGNTGAALDNSSAAINTSSRRETLSGRPSTGGSSRLAGMSSILSGLDGKDTSVHQHADFAENSGNGSSFLNGSSLSRPRERLESIRDSLTFASRPSVIQERPSSAREQAQASGRETDSQKKVLKRIQKRKMELSAQRKALRK